MTSPPPDGRHRRWTAERVTGALILAAIIASIAWQGITAAHDSAVTACQRRVNSAFQSALLARAADSAASNRALEALWDSLLTLHGTPAQRTAQFRADLAAWKASLGKIQSVTFPRDTANAACDG
jgi:hypothetical protein